MTQPDPVSALPVVIRGYDRDRVEALVSQLQRELAGATRRVDELTDQLAALSVESAGPPAHDQAPAATPGTAPSPAATASTLDVDHVGVAVADVDTATALLGRLLGLRVHVRERNDDQQVDEAVLRPPGGTTGVQLVAPLSPDSPVGRFLERRGPGLHHLAFRVADVAAAADVLRRQGVRVLDDEPRPGTAGSRITFVHPRDCGGVLVELVEQPGHEGSSGTRHED